MRIRSTLVGACITAFLMMPLAAGLTGCNNQPGHNNNAGKGDKGQQASAPDTSKLMEEGPTLPVLDALFFEDRFEEDLQSKLKLSKEQVQQLKQVARNATGTLDEDATDYNGSSRAAARQFDEQVSGVIGQQKTAELSDLIRQYAASGKLKGLMPTQPNAVPTDTRILVNAPAFRMDAFENGKLVKSYRVGIGYPEFPLPTGMREADQIIFNPTWTPPDEPWVKGKVQAGKKVAAGSKLNPLGPVKIPIGLPSLIHGGKSVAKLGNFASHGCVGLTNEQVQDFTELLSRLAGTPLSADSIAGFAEKKTKTKTVKLEHSVPVELRYETIVAENGVLHIYRDVYERGTNTPGNAKRVLNFYGVDYDKLPAAEKDSLNAALEEMNRDAHGDPIAVNETAANTVAANDTSRGSDKGDKKEGKKTGKVTSKVQGRKEVAVTIAGLQGKGYPAPADLNDGGAAMAQQGKRK